MFFSDYIFPLFCLRCNAEGEWVCAECLPLIGTFGVYACPACHKPNGDGLACRQTPLLLGAGARGEVQCGTWLAVNHTTPLSSLRAVIAYKEGSIAARLIQAFKYDFAEDCFRILEKIITGYLQKHRGVWADIDAIVPVPLHPRRFAERGFNQAEKIVAAVSRSLSLPVFPALKRCRYTEPQAQLNKIKREANVAGAFEPVAEVTVAGKRLLLVDDVYTTGSTMQECARILLTRGATDVRGFTIARG